MKSSNPPRGAELPWRIARSCDGGACVRVAPSGEMVVIGDSKNPDGPVLFYPAAAWNRFVRDVKNGAFDHF